MSHLGVSGIACVVLVAFPALPTGFQLSSQSTVDRRFVGTWRLASGRRRLLPAEAGLGPRWRNR